MNEKKSYKNLDDYPVEVQYCEPGQTSENLKLFYQSWNHRSPRPNAKSRQKKK